MEKRERTSPPAEISCGADNSGAKVRKKLPYWNWISHLVNFAILTGEYFAEFYFQDFNRQMWKKDNKIHDLTILNFILFFQKSEPLKTFPWTATNNVWNLCKLKLFQKWRYKKELTSRTSQQFVFVHIHIHVNCCYDKLILFLNFLYGYKISCA